MDSRTKSDRAKFIFKVPHSGWLHIFPFRFDDDNVHDQENLWLPWVLSVAIKQSYLTQILYMTRDQPCTAVGPIFIEFYITFLNWSISHVPALIPYSVIQKSRFAIHFIPVRFHLLNYDWFLTNYHALMLITFCSEIRHVPWFNNT